MRGRGAVVSWLSLWSMLDIESGVVNGLRWEEHGSLDVHLEVDR